MDHFIDLADTKLREFIEIIDEAEIPEYEHQLIDDIKNQLAILRQQSEILLNSIGGNEDGTPSEEDSYD